MFHPRRIYMILFILGIAVLPLPAATVSFLVVETGLGQESPIPESSTLWEAGMMDVFFEAGHIVSNAPVLRIDDGRQTGSLPPEALEDFTEAAENGADFFIISILDYGPPPQGDEGDDAIQRKPRTISLQIHRVYPRSIVFEGRLRNPETMKDSAAELTYIKEAVKPLISRIKG